MRALLLLFLVKQKKIAKKLLLAILLTIILKGAAVPIDLVKSTYSVEEESTIISFDVRKV